MVGGVVLQEDLLRDNLSRLYGMKDELEKTYRTQIDLVHSRYRGIAYVVLTL